MKATPAYCNALIYLASDSFKFTVSRITTIKVIGNSPPEPFRIFEDISEKIGTFFLTKEIYPTYENVKNLQEWIVYLFENGKKKSNYDAEEKIYAMII